MSNELGDFTILGILLSSDDEVDEAGRVPEDRGCVCLGHPHKAGRVHLEGHDEDGGIDVPDGLDGHHMVLMLLMLLILLMVMILIEEEMGNNTAVQSDLDDLVVDPDPPVPIGRSARSDCLDEDAKLLQSCVRPHPHP